LNEDAVDLFQINGLGLILDGLQETGETEVSGSSDYALAGTDDESKRFLSERIVSQPGLIEFGQDPRLHVVGSDLGHDDRIGDAAFDILVIGQTDGAQQGWLADKDKVVVLREILKKEAQFSQAVDIHEMSVVNDGGDHLAEMIQPESLLDETLFAQTLGT
jgi:hypothetical protein